MSHRFFYRFFAIGGVIALAAILRLWQIDSIPPGFHLDESYQGLEAWRILTEPEYHPFYLRGNFGPLPANAYLNVFMFWLVTALGGEAGPIAMRLTASMVGLLTVLSMFALAIEIRGLSVKDIATSADTINSAQHKSKVNKSPTAALSQYDFSPTFPLFAAFFLAAMRWHIHYSRMGIESIYVPFIWTTATWLLLKGWRTGSLVHFVTSGVVVGVGMYTYRGAWVIPIILGLISLHLLIARWFEHGLTWGSVQKRLWQSLSWAAVSFLVVSPLLWFYVNNPSLFTVRLEQVNIVGETGSPADATVWTNAIKTAKMFGPFGTVGDPDPRRNLPEAAALSWPFALFFYIGIGVSLWRIRRPIYALPLYGLIGLLLPGVFSEFAPHFHRIFGAAAPTALLCALGLDTIWQWLTSHRRRFDLGEMQSVAMQFVMIGLLLIGTILEANNYFSRWANISSIYHAFDVGFWEMGKAIAALPEDAKIYISPRNMEHHTLAFAWEQNHPRAENKACSPLPFDGRHVFPLTDGANEQPEYYAVIEHEDFRTPLLVPGVLPDSTIYQEFVDYSGQVYGRIYERPAMSRSPRLPQNSMEVALGDGIRLAGYDLQPDEIRRGEILYLQLHWVVEKDPTADWTVFTHVRTLSPESPERVAGYDSKPGNGSYPMSCWMAGQRILDEYQIRLPDDLPEDEYELYIGLYQPSGEQLPADGNGIKLGTVQILSPMD